VAQARCAAWASCAAVRARPRGPSV
jgi:hypothetical protein